MCFWPLNYKRNFICKNIYTSKGLVFSLLTWMLFCMIEFVNIYPREDNWDNFEVHGPNLSIFRSWEWRSSRGVFTLSLSKKHGTRTLTFYPDWFNSKKNTRQNTKGAVKVLEDWQHAIKKLGCDKGKGWLRTNGLATLQPVTCRIEQMSVETLNLSEPNVLAN